MLKPTLILLLTGFSFCLYVPQILLTSSAQFLNYQLSKNGPTIQNLIENATIPDITFDDKFQGVAVKLNLTQIKQKVQINWEGNTLSVKDPHTFSVVSKNINVTIDGRISFKIAGAISQKGNLSAQITKLQTDTRLQFQQPKCDVPNQGIGFDVQISQIFENSDKIDIKILNHGLDNIIINLLISLLQNRLPSIINNVALNTVNPLITSYTCMGIEQTQKIGENQYVIIVNTTQIPQFVSDDIFFPVDITVKNQQTNATNDQVENNNLPFSNEFNDKANATAIISSNMLNSLLWLIDDSKVLSINITNSQLGPNPPIQLNTKALSILMPGLRAKWPERQVILLIEPSNRFSHLYIRNGKIVSALSLSIKFVVNETSTDGEQVKQCISAGRCVVACNLNATIPLSAALNIHRENYLKGLLHSLAIAQLQIIETVIQINLRNLQNILTVMIGSFRPQINKSLQDGITLNTTIVQKYGINGLYMSAYQDYAAFGVVFDN